MAAIDTNVNVGRDERGDEEGLQLEREIQHVDGQRRIQAIVCVYTRWLGTNC